MNDPRYAKPTPEPAPEKPSDTETPATPAKPPRTSGEDQKAKLRNERREKRLAEKGY